MAHRPSASCPNEEVRTAQHSAYLGLCRGLELVNSPDKGNQNIFAGKRPWADRPADIGRRGKVFWSVTAAPPALANGVANELLAKSSGNAGVELESSRTARPAEQLEGGELNYQLSAATPDFGTYHVQRQALRPATPRLNRRSFVRVRAGEHEAPGAAGALSPSSLSSEYERPRHQRRRPAT